MFFSRPRSTTPKPREPLIKVSSGYRYRPSEIANYIRWQRHYPAIFCDFKNTTQDTHHSLQMFTASDVIQLLTYPVIRAAVEQHEAFMTLRDWVSGISDITLHLMHELAIISECMENPGIALNPDVLGKLLTEPLLNLYDHLYQETEIAYQERRMLAAITSAKGVLSAYTLGRTNNFITDLEAFAFEQKCGAGFNRNLAGLYAAVQSCKLYALAMWQLFLSDNERFRLFQRSRAYRTNTLYASLPMDNNIYSQNSQMSDAPNSSLQEGIKRESSAMTDDSEETIPVETPNKSLRRVQTYR